MLRDMISRMPDNVEINIASVEPFVATLREASAYAQLLWQPCGARLDAKPDYSDPDISTKRQNPYRRFGDA